MQPPSFTPSVQFQHEESAQISGRSTVRTAALDAQFAAIAAALDVYRTNLGLIQRDDGEIRDGMVKLHTLSAEVLALISSGVFTVRGAWASAVAYAKGDLVVETGIIWMAPAAHTSGVFADDLAAGLWAQLTSQEVASSTVFSATATLTATNVQAAIEELDADLRPAVQAHIHQEYRGL